MKIRSNHQIARQDNRIIHRNGQAIRKAHFVNEANIPTSVYRRNGLAGFAAELVIKNAAIDGHHNFRSTEIEAWVERNYPDVKRGDVILLQTAGRLGRHVRSLDDFIYIPKDIGRRISGSLRNTSNPHGWNIKRPESIYVASYTFFNDEYISSHDKHEVSRAIIDKFVEWLTGVIESRDDIAPHAEKGLREICAYMQECAASRRTYRVLVNEWKRIKDYQED